MPIKPAEKPKNIPCACSPFSMVSLHLMAPDSLRQSSAMHIRIRPNFPGLGRGLFRAISSGNWPQKFFSLDFLRQLAEKVFFKRFPQAFGRKASSDFLRQSSAMHIHIRPNFSGLGRGLSLLQARIDGSLRFRFNDFEQRSTFALKEITARRDSTHEKDLHSMDDRRRIRRL